MAKKKEHMYKREELEYRISRIHTNTHTHTLKEWMQFPLLGRVCVVDVSIVVVVVVCNLFFFIMNKKESKNTASN